MANFSLDDYIQQKGISQRSKAMANQNGGNKVVKSFKRASLSDHVFPTKIIFDARERLNKTVENTEMKQKQDARLKLLGKRKLGDTGQKILSSQAPNIGLQVGDARAKLLTKQTMPKADEFGCEVMLGNNKDNFQLSTIKKTLMQGTDSQGTSNFGWSLTKTVTNDTVNLLQKPDLNSDNQFTSAQAQLINQIANVASRKVSQGNNNLNPVKVAEKVEEKALVQTFVSPLQSFRVIVSNLGPNVTYDDIEELFGSCGPLRKVKMSKPGSAEIFYINMESAYEAAEEYHNRELDDKPMSVVLAFLQDMKKLNETKPLRSKKQLSALKQSLVIDPSILNQALFRATSEQLTNPVDFTVHL